MHQLTWRTVEISRLTVLKTLSSIKTFLAACSQIFASTPSSRVALEGMEEGISRKQETPAADFFKARPEEWMPSQTLAAGSRTSNHSGLSESAYRAPRSRAPVLDIIKADIKVGTICKWNMRDYSQPLTLTQKHDKQCYRKIYNS